MSKKPKVEGNLPTYFLSDDFKEIFFNGKKDNIPWSHCFYKIFYNARRLFCNPQSKKDLNLIEQVESLLNSAPSEPSSDLINKCQHFIKLHRIIENTNARKRLEKWATRIIACYLLIVLIIVILSNSSHIDILSISDTIMITILSTTTVNIIGLGLIVLRGHFYTNGEEFNKSITNEKEDKKEK